MRDAIKETIRQHLPAEVGETLREELETGRKAVERCKALEGRVVELELKKSLWQDVEQRGRELTELEATLNERERQLKIKELELKVEARETVANNAMELVRQLCRNTVFRENYFHHREYNGDRVKDGKKKLTE